MNTEERLKAMMDAARVEDGVPPAPWTSFVRRAHRPLYARRAAVAVGSLALVAIAVVGAQVLLANDDITPPLPPAGTPTPSPTGSPDPSPSPAAPSTVDVPAAEHELWLVQEELLSWGTTTMGGKVSRDVAGDDLIAQKAAFWLERLLDGPMSPDAEVGATTAIPKGTELLGVKRNGSTLEVDLSSEFESGGGSLSMQLRVGQVVYTATQFEGITAVRFKIEGRRVTSIGGEGVMVEDPLDRGHFQNVAPAIVLETPKPEQEISSPVTVAGFANVFEANVVIRIVDAKGKTVVETFTTATCGTGCWGDYSEDVSFDVAKRQQGRVMVLFHSAEDGSEHVLAQIPVVLMP